MAKTFSLPMICLLLLAITFGLANSSRILDDVTNTDGNDLPPLPQTEDTTAQAPDVQPDETQPNPDDDIAPASGGYTGSNQGASSSGSTSGASAANTGGSTGTTQGATSSGDISGTSAANAGGSTGTAQGATSSGSITGASAANAGGSEKPTISFYMHDILGGSHASGRIVTGLIATQNANGIPFSRPNSQVFPVSNGVPLANNNLNSLFNNNNINSAAGLNGQNQQQSTVISNAGTNNVINGGSNTNNQAFVTPGQLPSGITLQKLMFGSITVIDDELTEGHELGSDVLGKGQGFYLASSLDGESHTMAFTALFPNEHEDDTISFFGVHRTASPISQIAIVGGTGKYENANGYATIETLPQQDQHTTDGVDTIAHICVYITY